MKAQETDEFQAFKPSFHSRNSLGENFDRNLQVLKSLGSMNLSDKNDTDTRGQQTQSFVPSQEYLLEVPTSPNQKFQHEISHKYSIRLEDEVMSLRYNSTGSLLACGTTNGSAVIIDNESGSLVKSLTVSFDKNSVNTLRWKPNVTNSQIITAASVDGSLVSYNITKNQLIGKLQPRKGSQILCSDYNHDGKLLALGTDKGDIILWNDFTQQKERILDSSNWFNNGHSNRVFSVKFVCDEPNMLLSGGWDKAVFLWDIRDPKAR